MRGVGRICVAVSAPSVVSPRRVPDHERVHRHTVRHRLRRAEALLGRSLDDPGVRAELWLALTRTPA